MPLSRKRPPPPHAGWRNAVRGGIDSKTSIANLRASSPIGTLPVIAEWVVRSQRHRPPLDGLVPRSLTQISSVPSFAAVPLDRELAWAVGTLRAVMNKLRRYVELRQLLEGCLQRSQYAEAIELVDKINVEVCWSLEMLSARIALTSLVYGLEAQKSWITAKTSAGASVAALFYSYWFGVRSENDQNPSRFLSEIAGHIHRVWTDAAGKRFLNYQLANRDIENGDEAEMLAQAQTLSVLDLYECVVHLARVSAAEGRPTAALLYRSVLPLMFEIGDIRALKISYLMGNLSAADDFSTTGFQFDEKLISSGIDGIPAAGNLHQAHFASNLGVAPKVENVSADLANSVADIQLRPEKLDAAREHILRHAVLFPRFNIGEFATAITKLAEIPHPLSDAATQRRRFMANNDHDPTVIPYLPDPLGPHYGGLLTSSAGCPPVVVGYHSFDPLQPPSGIDANARAWWTISVLARAKDNLAMVEELSSVRSGELPATRLATWCEIEGLLAAGRINAAVDLVAEFYRRDNGFLQWLPLARLATRLDDQTVGRYSGSTNMALVTWLLAENHDREFRSSLSYAVERFLDDRGVLRPSELRPDHVDDLEKLVFLLSVICTEETLSLSLTYGNQFELDEERLAILATLKSLSSERSEVYDEEIKLILRRQEVVKAIKSLDRSKISMDEEPIRDWARKNLRGKFDRFRALTQAGMETVSDKYLLDMLDRLASGAPDTKPYEIPDNEVSALFAEILDQLCRESSLNSRHGINSYLSLRIRHGTISGQLRRPSQEQHLLTTVSSGGSYAANDHWYELLEPHVGHDDADRVSRALGGFSKKYDLVVERFSSDFVQIRRVEKPKGLISYRFADAVVMGFSAEAQGILEFDEFLDSFFEIYWVHLGNVLGTVQTYIRVDLRNEFDALFDELWQHVNDATSAPNLPMLNDALIRARTGVHDALNEMAEWFDVPQAVESAPLMIDVLVEIGKQMVRRLNPNFDPVVELSGQLDVLMTNALTVFTDALFILFGNVAKHADLDRPAVTIAFDQIDPGVLQLTFESECRDISLHRRAIEEAITKLKSADVSKDVSGEGGTGFPKLAKIMAFSSAPEPVVIGIDEESGRFFCKLKFSFRFIRQTSEERDHAVFGS